MMGSWWPMCMFVTVPLIIGTVLIVTFTLVVPRAPLWLILGYYPLVFVTFAGLCGVSCRNPGLVAKREKVRRVRNLPSLCTSTLANSPASPTPFLLPL